LVSNFKSFNSTSKAEITMNNILGKLSPASAGFLLGLFLDLEDGGDMFPPSELDGVAIQKTAVLKNHLK
jgi:hypothetical protein